jgi:N-acyl-phosphatidylethanolamine-hydrolysing phospholipase D
MKKLLTWSKMGILAGLLPSPVLRMVQASEREVSSNSRTGGLSLREIVHRKTHHGNGRFRNPFCAVDLGSPWPILKWKLFSKNHFKSLYDRERVVPVTADWEAVKKSDGLSVTFLKHAGVMIKDLDTYILVDPVFYSPSWFIEDFTPIAFEPEEMPRPDHVLITHGHYDHLDVPTLASFPKETHTITPLGYKEVFDDFQINRRTQLDWFDTCETGRCEVTLLPCNHWTMRNPLDGPNRSLWGSYLIKTAAGPTIYVSGDTGYFEGFSEIGKEFSIDLAIMNLGAYEPRWIMAANHMNPAETVKAFKDLGAGKLFIVHWGTFRLGDEPVYLPPIQIRQELEKENLLSRLVQPVHGETLFL